MPEAFERCVRNGGRVTTEKLPGGKYRHICHDEKGKHKGHIKTKKKEGGK